MHFLWEYKQEDLAKRLYRDATSRLRLVLEENGILNLVNFGHGSLLLNTNGVECDLLTNIANENDKSYFGEYMRQYGWSFENQNYLDF